MSGIGEVHALGSSIRWTISDLVTLLVKGSYFYASREFQFWESSWLFFLYPNGSGMSNSGWITLYLVQQKSKYFKEGINFTFSVKDRDGKDYIIAEAEDKGFDTKGVSRFIERSKLLEDINKVALGSKVTFFCTASLDEKVEKSATPTKGKSPEEIEMLERLSNDFGKIYNSQAGSDCVLKCGGVCFPAHRLVLSVRSEVFAAMFHHDNTESRSGQVDIPDIDPSTMGHVLDYIYKGKVGGLTVYTAVNMYVAADKYGLQEMRNACLEWLLHNLTLENICDAIVLADIHGELKLFETATRFVDKNLHTVLNSDPWNELLRENPLLANKVLSEAYLQCKR